MRPRIAAAFLVLYLIYATLRFVFDPSLDTGIPLLLGIAAISLWLS